MTRYRRRVVLLLVLAVASGVVGFAVWRVSYAALGLAADDVMPSGRWHRLPPSAEDDRAAEERARTLSLPYLSGRIPAEAGATGVVRHDPQRAWAGVNLYTSGHGPEALLVDMRGRVLHRWRHPFERAFPERRPIRGTEYFRRARLLPGGDLLAIYQGGGLVRLSRDGEKVWGIAEGFYNDLRLGPDGNLYTLTKRARVVPAVSVDETVLEDSLTVISLDGEVLHRVSLLQAMLRSPYADLLDDMESHGDILHSNTVEPLDGRAGGRSPLVARGNVLFSLRQVGVIGILEPGSGRVLWAARGPWRMQHQPTLLPGGELLLFDNRGAGDRARVLRVTVPEGRVVWEYPGPPGRPLHSPEAGVVQPLPNGNLLITESESGRAIEIDPEGEVVWEFVSPHRAGRDQELVATLFDVVRLPRPGWLEGSG